jgi:putative aminopeptidase FrvX
MDYSLLEKLQAIHAPAGDEVQMKIFLLNYVKENMQQWVSKPQIIYGDDFQDCLMLKFGKPRTAIFAHMDSIGFTVRYGKQLVKLGGPVLKSGTLLIGHDSGGAIETELGGQ